MDLTNMYAQFAIPVMPEYAPPGSQVDDPEARRQEIAAGLQGGTLRYTPLQKHDMARNSQVRAWLSSNDVPDDVRQRELAKLDQTEQRIQPIPVPPDELPKSPEQQISANAWVDVEGKFSAPGTTWVANQKTGGWAPDRNSPNNDLEYLRSTQGDEGEMGAPSFGMGGVGPALGAAIGAEAMGGGQHGGGGQPYTYPGRRQRPTAQYLGPPAQSIQDQVRRTMAQQKQQHAEQQQQWKQAEAERKHQESQAKQEQAMKAKQDREILDLYNKEIARQGKVIELEGGQVDEDKAWASAQKAFGLLEARRTEQAAAEQSNQHLEGEFAGMSDAEVKGYAATLPATSDDRTRMERELARRVKSRGDVPRPPFGMLPRLQKMTPTQLEIMRREELQYDDPTREQYHAAVPNGSYERYMQLRKWLKTPGPLTVPGAAGARATNAAPVPPPPRPVSPAPVRELGPDRLPSIAGGGEEGMPDVGRFAPTVMSSPATPAAPTRPAYDPETQRLVNHYLPRPTTKAEYDALPTGQKTKYVHPDGSVREKP